MPPLLDAHCHPSDTMAASTAAMPSMRASILAVMATRAQDQHLVHTLAADYGVRDASDYQSLLHDDGSGARVVPAFGWHPWFSHQLYDDTAAEPTYIPPHKDDNTNAKAQAAKLSHYQAVLSPSPSETDVAFIDSLPPPQPLSTFLSSTRTHLSTYPLALVGEVGIDKAFRLPEPWTTTTISPPSSRDDELTPGGREGRRLSPYRVRMPHQQTVLRAQLALAGAENRAVSVHGVQAHGVLFETVAATWKGHERRVQTRRQKRMVAAGAEDSEDEDDDGSEQAAGGRPYPPRVCLHSFSGSSETLKQWLAPSIPADIFFSFSAAVNLGDEEADDRQDRLVEVVRLVPDDRLLVESDLHRAGEAMDAALDSTLR